MGQLGVKSACSLAPSAVLFSAATTLPFQEDILSASFIEDADVNNTRATWSSLTMASETIQASKHIQRT